MTDRQYVKESAKKLLTGVFNNIRSFDDPVVMPRVETRITYPHSYDNIGEVKAEIFEGLTRTLFIAAPLIRECEDLTINGINIRDYYKAHILHAVTKGDRLSVGSFKELHGDSEVENYRTHQQTVETCALVIGLWETKEQIWDTYTKEEQDRIADFLYEYAVGYTVPQNWRLFNMLDLAFLNLAGYEIDKRVMKEHACAIDAYYAGDGWYRDGHSFDYYSCWAFNVYGPLWNLWYGYENEPELAKHFEQRSNELIKNYDKFFDKDGFTNMWGRSSIYRFAATSPFAANLMLKEHGTDYGTYRRILVGSLKQFMERPDFIGENGVPTMGFYRQFAPLVQGYSCAESVFWIGKAFLCLHFKEDDPLWSSEAENEAWPAGTDGVEPLVSEFKGPGLVTADFPASGETVLRSGKVLKNTGDLHGMFNYSKLCFNTKYPWEAVDFSQMYTLTDDHNGKVMYPNVTFYGQCRDDVFYRMNYFDFNLGAERHWINGIRLADIAVPYGIMRADRTKLFRKGLTFTLGAYGFPDNGTTVKRFETELEGRKAYAVVLLGKDSLGNDKQMAYTVYEGFSEIELLESIGTDPESEKSIIPYARFVLKDENRYEQSMLISQVLTKESSEEFTLDEIFPIDEIRYADEERHGGYGTVQICLKTGKVVNIDFDGMEGEMSI